MLVLSVQVDESVSELPNQSGGRGRAVHPDAIPSRSLQLTPNDQPAVVHLQTGFGTPLDQLGTSGEIEAPFDQGAIFALAHEVGRGPLAEQEGERLHENRLPGPRLAAQHRQSRL